MSNITEFIDKAICIDNIELLDILPPESIDLVYIDPPFFSNVDYVEFNDQWISLQQYIAFIKKRIVLIHKTLKTTGSFYLHCDPSASHYLKMVCDDVFGYDRFRSEIVWNVGSISGFKSQKKGWIRSHDIILHYTKSNEFTFNKLYLSYSRKYLRNFTKEDEKGKYKVWHDKKQYLRDKLGMPISDVWNDIFSYQTRTMCKEYQDYKYPTMKPLELVERIILASSNENDIVADFFCGSGTFLAIAKKHNRRFIGCDNNQNAIEITNDRLNIIVSLNTSTFY